MSVLIKGMEMPTSCYACMFFAQTDYWNKEDEADVLSHCKRTGEKTWESVNGYLPNCPLVLVPTHGKLIDADILAAKCDDPYWCVWLSDIDDAPTVIPAEPEEEEMK